MTTIQLPDLVECVTRSWLDDRFEHGADARRPEAATVMLTDAAMQQPRICLTALMYEGMVNNDTLCAVVERAFMLGLRTGWRLNESTRLRSL